MMIGFIYLFFSLCKLKIGDIKLNHLWQEIWLATSCQDYADPRAGRICKRICLVHDVGRVWSQKHEWAIQGSQLNGSRIAPESGTLDRCPGVPCVKSEVEWIWDLDLVPGLESCEPTGQSPSDGCCSRTWHFPSCLTSVSLSSIPHPRDEAMLINQHCIFSKLRHYFLDQLQVHHITEGKIQRFLYICLLLTHMYSVSH